MYFNVLIYIKLTACIKIVAHPQINTALQHYLGTKHLDFRRENNSTIVLLIYTTYILKLAHKSIYSISIITYGSIIKYLIVGIGGKSYGFRKI